jgi:hypothetical protein
MFCVCVCVCVCVCLSVEERSLIELVPAPVNLSRRGVTSNGVTPPLVEEESLFKNMQISWKKTEILS